MNELANDKSFNVDFKPAELEFANFAEMERLVADYALKYKGLVFTKDDKQSANKARSELLAFRNALDEERKRIKRIYNEPLDEFESKVKKLTSTIDEPLESIRGGLKEIDNVERRERETALNAFLSEKCATAGVDIGSVEIDGRWLNKGMWADDLEPKTELLQGVNIAIKEAVKNKEHHEMQIKVLTEFCKAKDIDPSGWVSQLEHRSATEVIDLINLDFERKERLAKEFEEKKKAHEEFTKRQEDAVKEASDFTENPEDKTLITSDIRVTGTIKQLGMLKKFLADNGITVEAVPSKASFD